ncbi:hypothetical protein CAS74_000163 [Pichia kudriavzevii]|uniref:Ubiquitin-like domain-containing protein n=1 Tax=Pichia kudriavzevii TaxID=4909 RepID=A0A1Z8JT69_PICKU|nr:hypothetical protein CAS74_000163 [Pichia kudriavzevii]
MSTEVQFANQFVQLLQVTKPTPEEQDAFLNGFRIQSVNSIPATLTFPPLKHPYIATSTKAESTENNEEEMQFSINVTFKSLKPPRFNISVSTDITTNTKFYHLKHVLANALKDQHIGIVDLADVKLMIRAKTMQDSDAVSTFLDGDKLALNVLVSKVKPLEEEVEHVKQVQKGVSDESWEKIRNVLLSDLEDVSKVDQLISSMKKLV